MLERYRALVAAGELRPDSAQEHAAEALDRLQGELADTSDRGGGLLGRLFKRSPTPRPRGLYHEGGPGRTGAHAGLIGASG